MLDPDQNTVHSQEVELLAFDDEVGLEVEGRENNLGGGQISKMMKKSDDCGCARS